MQLYMTIIDYNLHFSPFIIFSLRFVILFFTILIIIGTFYTELRKNKDLSLDDRCDDFGECKKFTFIHDTLTSKQLAIADKFWSCFDIQKNYEFIMSSSLGKDSLEPIHGIRTIGILWIIVGMKSLC